MYVITEWLERYEVNDKGQPARRGDKLRVRPLEYIRSKVHGRSQGAGFLAMQTVAGERDYEVFGLFEKFLEIAGCEKGGRRGALLNHRGQPATIEELALTCRKPTERVKFALEVLTNSQVGWMVEIDSAKFPEIMESGNLGKSENPNRDNDSANEDGFQESPESVNIGKENEQIPEIPGALYNETKRNENGTEQNSTKRVARAHAREGPASEEPPADEALGSGLRACSASARLGFGNQLRQLLCPQSTADLSALWNAQHWAEAQPDGVPQRILKIAHESRSGRNPLAVFFSRLDRELGYRPRAEKGRQQ